mmetsp:Transcript_71173/g.119025  ORF Transcript_71173/g.119025 Transcript_71173/m.119025 type:complete len:138 (+) Transcript_71173:197-610(+)
MKRRMPLFWCPIEIAMLQIAEVECTVEDSCMQGLSALHSHTSPCVSGVPPITGTKKCPRLRFRCTMHWYQCICPTHRTCHGLQRCHVLVCFWMGLASKDHVPGYPPEGSQLTRVCMDDWVVIQAQQSSKHSTHIDAS